VRAEEWLHGRRFETTWGDPRPSEDTTERLAVDTPTADLDRSSRDTSIRNSIAIAEMEGRQPSAFCRAQLGLFVP